MAGHDAFLRGQLSSSANRSDDDSVEKTQMENGRAVQTIRRLILSSAVFPLLGVCISPVNAAFTVLHAYSGPDGANPRDAVTVVGNAIYGTTVNGGGEGDGVAFSMNLDGTNYHVLHGFSGGSDGN